MHLTQKFISRFRLAPSMKWLIFVLPLFARMAVAQGALPWGGPALSVPLLATQPGVAMFYVSSYTWVGVHTDYDMARQAADAYLTENPETPTYLVLGPAQTQTCDDVPLPSVSLGNGTSSTVSIIGYGSRVSNIIKRVGCAASSATLRVSESANGPVINAWYQGFTVSANHIDGAACGFYGLANSTLLDVACGNAVPGADHELEVGNLDANSMGEVRNISIMNLKAFDNVGGGKGAILTPQWSAGRLAAVVLGSGGAKMYSQQYTRAQLVGPGLSSCSIVPTLTPVMSSLGAVNYPSLPTVHYGYVTGATITNPGNCSNTGQLYILIQDGVPVLYGMKFSYMVMSHVWNLESTASSYYGEAWLRDSVKNLIIGEHTYTNQTIQIREYGALNNHVNAYFDGPGEYGAVIDGKTGSFSNSIFSWDSATYPLAVGYYLGVGFYQAWTISNSQCTNSTVNFTSIETAQGPLLAPASAPSGVSLKDIERCDGSNSVDWPTQVGPQ
jgi:hypothetical protein